MFFLERTLKMNEFIRTIRVFYCILLISAFVLTGCITEPPNKAPSGTPAPTGTVSGSGSETQKNDVTSTPEPTPVNNNAKKLTLSEIEELAAKCVFHVKWFSKNGSFNSGTTFITDSEKFNTRLLITAFHFLVPDGEEDFTGDKLPDYILGGELSYAKSGEKAGATLKNCVVISDAAPVPDIAKDVSAFTLNNGDNLATLPLSTREVNTGDKIYLLANLWNTEDVHENCVYEGTAMVEQEGMLVFRLTGDPGTAGASGGPIINEYGEVIGIHMASNGTTLYAHSTKSFLEQINAGTISSVTYPEDLSEYYNEAEETPWYMHAYNEEAETDLFKMKITSAAFSDENNGTKASEGKQFLTLNVDISPNGKYSPESHPATFSFALIYGTGMFANATIDFSNVNGENILTGGKETSSISMTFEIGREPEYLYLYYTDYSTSVNDEGQTVYSYTGEHYFTIPSEGF